VVSRASGLAWLALAGAACTPIFDDHPSLVSSPRLLAVQATPADAPLGATFAMRALYVDEHGPRDASALDWAMCLRQKPLGEPGPIDPGCFADAASGLVPLGSGASAQATIPPDACQLFGPDSPPPGPGQPSARPTDPDTTGGFYLPVRLKTPEGDGYAALERLACQPSGVSPSTFLAFTGGYHVNTNPAAASLSKVEGDSATPIAADGADAAAPLQVAPGAHLELRVEWPACQGTDPCDGAEGYLAIDPATKQVVTRRESMVASWFATSGAFDEERNGRAESDLAASASNGWTAPPSPGTVHLWVVLRDARGGVGWTGYTLTVHP
jgi:hypothetical protein